ncbi:MAG: GNAT family N-acetyltransferase [Gemmatimonadetes bacterium]|nr:GNAT family N-acetyltransferase [Gemmatimonadota bacterium]
MTTRTDGALRIRNASGHDLPEVERLLVANGLILDDVAAGIADFFVAEEDGALVGTIGLEVRTPFALLRSAAVDPARHGAGIGAQLVARLVAEAKGRGLRALYLFTPGAAPFFERHGFMRTAREAVPEELRSTGQFTHACGATAVTMVRDLAR